MVDFYRNVHCLMGLPIDGVSLAEAAQRLQHAKISGQRCFFSTPNLNFIIASQENVRLRDSVSQSDLSLADGMPLIWVAKILGIPVKSRVSGSGLFDFLRHHSSSLWNVFFFGGPKGVGQEACLALGGQQSAMRPTGYIYPGFGNLEKMSDHELIACINASQSDILVVSLGAAKGQEWIYQNLDHLKTPVIAHLGAVINFIAGTVKRAPAWMQNAGLEWLWRIKEEHRLLDRYVRDGLGFLKLLATQVLPLAIWQRWIAPRESDYANATVSYPLNGSARYIELRGAWRQGNLGPLRQAFSQITSSDGHVTIDMQHVSGIDSAFIGLLILLEISLHAHNHRLEIINLAPALAWQIKLSGVAHLV